MIPNIGLFDIFLGVFYLLIIYFLVFRFQSKIKLPNLSFNYFIGALSIKIIASVTFVLLSIFYYQSGDTFLYFEIAEELREHLFLNLPETTNLLITPYSGLEKLDYHPLQVYNYQVERSTTWAFSKIVFFFNLISFGSYLVSSILMGLASFLGLWLGYHSLAKLYSLSKKLLLIPFFGIPTALIWSSGILKDTILIGIVGFLIFIGINIFIHKKNILFNSTYFLISVFLLQALKPILVFILLPTFLFWGVLYFSEVFSSFKHRYLFRVGLVVTILASTFFISKNLPTDSKYNFDKLTITLIAFQIDHTNNKEANTAYNLGKMENSFLSVIQKSPQAINVSLFRPYLWEATNFPMLVSAMESFLLLLTFFFAIFSLREKIFKIFFLNKELIFFFTFSLAYGIITGLTAYNFGALSRFKIPVVMFFGLGLIILTNNKSTGND